MQEDMVPASKKRAQKFLNCSKWDAAVVHVISPWFSNAVAGLQLFPMQPGSMWRRHSCSWKIQLAISVCHRIACLDARLSHQNYPSAHGLAIKSCRMVFWCLVAPWLGWPVLSASSGPIGTLQLSFTGSVEGVVPGQSTSEDREGDHPCRRPRKLDTSSAACCRVVV